MASIKTRWADTVTPENALCEYPRPQMVRDVWLNLNGLYDYAVTPLNSEKPKKYDGKILVPFCIESALSGVEKPLNSNELLWYRRKFTLPKEYEEKDILLHFGAVDWKCRVWVNDVFVGEHTGGYCPFSLNITRAVRFDDENELTVEVYDPTDDGWQQRGKQVLKTHGFWYTATSGIWQTVWIEPVSRAHISSVKVIPDIDSSSFAVEFKAEQSENAEYKLVVYDNGDEIVKTDVIPNQNVKLPDAKLWSPENPFLYDFKLEMHVNGECVDSVKSYFGMRKFSIDKDKNGIPRLFLNNKPYFQKGLLDQGYWCESLLTPPTDEAMIYDIQTIKDLGFNMLRKHIKVEPARWYYHCDRIGVIVWQDMVSGGKYIGDIVAGVFPNLHIPLKDNHYKIFNREKLEWRENFKAELFEMLENLSCFTCIGCWVPFNEGWGQFDAKEIGEAVKKYDPTRIVDHASGWYDQHGGDLKSIHKYIIPVRLPRLDGRPFALTEFGGYSRIINDHCWNAEKSFGYKMYKNKDSLTKAYRRLLEKEIIPLVPKGLSATIYTQVSDVEHEVNGIMTYDREIIKIDEAALRELNGKLIL